MRKVITIIVVGIIIAIFPLLALPPRLEMWILLFLGLAIVAFGLYEHVAQKEKDQKKEAERIEPAAEPQEPAPLSVENIPVANRGQEYRFDN